MNSSDQLAVSFVPSVLKRQFDRNHKRKIGDAIQEDYAVVLWIDICNFSLLCNRQMKDPVSGVEKITGILNSYYDFLLNAITEYGGQPLFIVGDGLMSAWPVNEINTHEAVSLAAVCANYILKNRCLFDDNNEQISLHAILSVGQWQMAELEGTHGNKLLSFCGGLFKDLTLAAKNKAPNELLILDRAISFLPKNLKRKEVKNQTSILYDFPDKFSIPHIDPLHVDEEDIQKLRLFVPPTLTFPLNKERLKWIAEIRPVSILFVRFPNSGKSTLENIEEMRELIRVVIPEVVKYDGLLNQVWMDEKESNLLICFGPSLFTHTDNPERAARLAYELNLLLKQNGFENSMGVSSGMAYCGVIGNDILRHYTVIGDVVNLSARLAAIKNNEVFCDKATFNATNKVLRYGDPTIETIKGFATPIEVYTPEGLNIHIEKKSDNLTSIGRKTEFDQLMAAFKKTVNGQNVLMIIAGESGIGKSKLLKDFKTEISSRDQIVLSAAGEFLTRNAPYGIWSQVFSALFEIQHVAAAKDQQEIYNSLATKYGNLVSLLNIVLHTDFPDSEEVRSMSGNQRKAATHEFLLQILDEESKKNPLVIIFDDAQWMDEISWELVVSINQDLHRCLIAVTFPTKNDIPQAKALKPSNVEYIVLTELNSEEIKELIIAKLGVAEISTEVYDLVSNIAKGNPFFCIELIGTLLDQKVLVIENGRCSILKGTIINESSIPETVRGAIRMRLDQLGSGSQLSLKVGSIVGMRFASPIVTSIYPIEMERKLVPDFLKEAENSGFINESIVDNLDGYFFNNATTDEVAYEMILAEQRRYLHRECALWYEKNFKDNLTPFFERIANHWLEAGEKKLAATYFEKQAIHLFELGFVKEALQIGLDGVRLLNYELERDPVAIGQKIGEHLAAVNALMADKTIKSLIENKKLKDENTEMVIKMLLELSPFAHQCQERELFALMSIICLRLTLEQGNGNSAAEVYSIYSIVYKALTGDSRTAFAWSNLALSVDKKNNNSLFSRVGFVHCWFIAHWLVPIRELIPVSRKAADAGFESGDILFACFNLSLTVVLLSTSGVHLDEVIKTASENFIRNNRSVLNASFHLMHEEQVAKALEGRTSGYTSLTDEKYDETKDIASICKTDLYNQIGFYYVSKLKLNAHFGNWEEALSWGDQSLPLLPAFANQPGHFEKEQFYAIAALYRSAETEGEMSEKWMAAANTCIDNMTTWSQLCPDNFLHKALLLQAIRSSMMGITDEAEKLFEQSALNANQAGFIQDCGLAFEHLVRMKKRIGSDYQDSLKAAIDAYQKWGAKGKVKYLIEQFGT